MRRFLNPISMFFLGLFLGAASRLLDIYTENLGEIFSQMAIWILLGTVISIHCPTKKWAMLCILPFCLGMLLTYYMTAVLTRGVYGGNYIIGWTLFSLCSPIMAYFAWMTKEKGWLSRLISVGIVVTSVLSSIVLFDHLRFYDFLIDGALLYFLFFHKVSRPQKPSTPRKRAGKREK